MRLMTRQLTFVLLIAAAFSFRCAITEAVTIWTGPDHTVTQPANAYHFPEIFGNGVGGVQDHIIPGEVVITRGKDGFICNTQADIVDKCKNNSHKMAAPLPLEFAWSGKNGNDTFVYGEASNWASHTFADMHFSLDLFLGAASFPSGDNGTPPLPGIVKIPAAASGPANDDIYFDLEMLDWGAGAGGGIGTGINNQGAFSYRRSTPEPTTLGLICLAGVCLAAIRRRRYAS